MWVGAAVGGLVLATGIGLALGRLSPPGHHAIVWDIGRMAAEHSKVSGPLAGFAAAAAVFLANQVREGLDSARIASVITLFLMSFVILAATAMEFGSTPNLSLRSDDLEGVALQRTAYCVATVGYYVGISMSWMAVHPLLLAIGLPAAADLFLWVLFVTVLGGAIRLAMVLVALHGVSLLAALALPVIGLAAAGAVRGFGVLLPEFWPSEAVSLHFAVLGFSVVAFGFAGQSLVLTTQRYAVTRRLVVRFGPWIHHALAQAAVMVVGLLWISIATA